MKIVFSSSLQRRIKLGGRRRPNPNNPCLSFNRYTSLALATPPVTCDYGKLGMPSLKNVYENDQLGDCVIAGGYHVRGLTSGNAGKLFIATNKQIEGDYGKIGGYVPGDPSTDQGCDEQTALNYWTRQGFVDGLKLAGWLKLDASNKMQLMQALWLFENLYFGIELPDAWIAPFPGGDGFLWNVAGAPVDTNGHCFIGYGYNDQGVAIDTWGLLGTMTWGAAAQYAVTRSNGEAYVLLSPDMVAKGQAKAPNGFDWATLISDFNALGGNLPVPVPAPPAPVPPAPPAHLVTLAQAQAWAGLGLDKIIGVATKSRAKVLASGGLAANWPK